MAIGKRRYGKPRTEAERKARHKRLYPGTKLPLRGTGRMRNKKIYVKNPKLKKRIFKSIKIYERLALKSYDQGKMVQGKKYEAKSDKLYKDNYYKMFGTR